MPNKNGTQTVANEKQAITVVDHEACGSQSGDAPGKHSITRRKKILVISTAVVIAAAATYFAWNAFHYEDTDNAQVHGHVIPVSARINGHIKYVYVSEGQLVHAGEALVTIDPQDYTIAEELAQVNLSEGLFTAGSSHQNVSADAEVSRRYLKLAQADLNLSYTVICSPVTSTCSTGEWPWPRMSSAAEQGASGRSRWLFFSLQARSARHSLGL